MFHKHFSFAFLAGSVFMAILALAPLVLAAPPADSQLKIFTRDRATIESDVNGWLQSQRDIIVDQIKANAYGNDYAVTVLYRAGGSGRVVTRVKIIDSNALSGSGEDDKTLETRAQEFISSLERTQTVRSVEVLAGSGPWDVFIVYDEKNKNPIQAVASEKQSPSILERVNSFINNLISPPAEQTGATAPAAGSAPTSSSQPAAETLTTATATTTAETAATTTPETTATTSPEETILPPQENIVPPPETAPEATTTPLSQAAIYLAAVIGLSKLGIDANFIATTLAIGALLILAFIFSWINKKMKQ